MKQIMPANLRANAKAIVERFYKAENFPKYVLASSVGKAGLTDILLGKETDAYEKILRTLYFGGEYCEKAAGKTTIVPVAAAKEAVSQAYNEIPKELLVVIEEKASAPKWIEKARELRGYGVPVERIAKILNKTVEDINKI